MPDYQAAVKLPRSRRQIAAQKCRGKLPRKVPRTWPLGSRSTRANEARPLPPLSPSIPFHFVPFHSVRNSPPTPTENRGGFLVACPPDTRARDRRVEASFPDASIRTYSPPQASVRTYFFPRTVNPHLLLFKHRLSAPTCFAASVASVRFSPSRVCVNPLCFKSSVRRSALLWSSVRQSASFNSLTRRSAFTVSTRVSKTPNVHFPQDCFRQANASLTIPFLTFFQSGNHSST